MYILRNVGIIGQSLQIRFLLVEVSDRPAGSSAGSSQEFRASRSPAQQGLHGPERALKEPARRYLGLNFITFLHKMGNLGF